MFISTIPLPAIPPIFLSLSVMKATEKMIISKPNVPWLSSQLQAPAAEKWPPAFPSFTTNTSGAFRQATAKFETFPIWNIPLKHPVNLAYEAATADLNDVNMIDPFHLEAYGVTTVNYNRDVEIFPVLSAIFEQIYGENPYKSPTDMGVNMAGNCIIDDEVCQEASRQEIIRRYYDSLKRLADGMGNDQEVYKLELLMKQAKVSVSDRPVVTAAMDREKVDGMPCAALELTDGRMITGGTSDLLGAASALLLNALKSLAGIDHQVKVISPESISPIQYLKTAYLGSTQSKTSHR